MSFNIVKVWGIVFNTYYKINSKLCNLAVLRSETNSVIFIQFFW